MKKRHIVMLVADVIYILSIVLFTVIPFAPYMTTEGMIIYFPNGEVISQGQVEIFGNVYQATSEGTYIKNSPFSITTTETVCVSAKVQNVFSPQDTYTITYSDTVFLGVFTFANEPLHKNNGIINPLGILLFANLLLSAFLVPLQIIKATKERNAKRRAIEEEFRYQRFKERMEREKRR